MNLWRKNRMLRAKLFNQKEVLNYSSDINTNKENKALLLREYRRMKNEWWARISSEVQQEFGVKKNKQTPNCFTIFCMKSLVYVDQLLFH